MRVDERILLGKEVNLEEEKQFKRLIKNILKYEDKEQIDILINYLYEYTKNMNKRFVTKVYKYLEELYYNNKVPIEKIIVFDDVKEDLYKILSNIEFKKKILEFIVYDLKKIDILEYYIHNILKGFNLQNREEKIFFEEFLSNIDNDHYYYDVLKIFIQYDKNNDINKDKEYYINLVCDKEIRKLIEGSYTVKDVLKHYNVKTKYSINALREMRKMSPNYKGRINLIDNHVFTIDEEGTNYYDDAFSVTKNSDGTYFLYVYISDIPSVIDFDSAILEDARRNGETIYYSKGCINMYPKYLIDKCLSLNEGNVKTVLAYRITFDNNFNMIDNSLEIMKANIDISKNISVDEANKFLEEMDNDYCEEIFIMYNIADKLRKSKKDLVSYRNDKSLYNNYSSIIIHEFMVLINSLLPKYFKEKEYPYIRRILSYKEDDINEIMNIFRSYNLTEKDIYMPLKTSLGKPIYSTSLNPHEGIGTDDYSHSSAPIRRYVDSLNEYLIYDIMLNNGEISDKDKYKLEKYLNRECSYLNNRSNEIEYFPRQYGQSIKKLYKR